MGHFFKVPLFLLAALGATFSSVAEAGAPKPPSAELRASLGTVAIVPGRFVPQSNFTVFAESKGKGAAKNVAQAITRALPAMKPSPTLAENLLRDLATETAVPLRSTAAEGPGSLGEKPPYKSLGVHGVDTVLEVAVTSVDLEGGDTTPLIAFFIDVSIRLVRVADNKQRYSRVFRWYGRKATLDAWIADNGRLLQEQFMQGYENLADQITTELFLLTPLKVHSGMSDLSAGEDIVACWLRPIYPEVEVGPIRHIGGALSGQYEPGKVLYLVVDSLQPQLEWGTFPREKDLKKHLPISDVHYDLRIWKVEAGYPESLVYERKGLPKPFHRVEHPLEPETKYFWSVRSRFKSDGRTEVTRWAFSGYCNTEQIPASPYAGYFRFATPKTTNAVAVPTPPATKAKATPEIRQGALSGSYKIGIFPASGCFASDGSAGCGSIGEEETAQALARVVRSGHSFTLSYSSYEKTLNIPPMRKPDRLWTGNAVRQRPDLTTVYAEATERGLDGVLMYWGDGDFSGGTILARPVPIELYAIDVSNKQVRVFKSMTDTVDKVARQALSTFPVGGTPPAVANATPTIQKGTVPNAYKVAIFPFGGDTPCTNYNRPPAEKIATDLANLIKRNGSLVLAYSYYDPHLNQLLIQNAERLWTGSRPDVARVASLAETHGVDAVVMYWRPDPSPTRSCSNKQPPYAIQVCLVDVKRQRLYRLPGIERDHIAMTEELLGRFVASVESQSQSRVTPK